MNDIADMNALVIGANSEALFSIQLAHQHGLKVTALDGNPEAAGLPAADEAEVVDINDLDAVYAITDRLDPKPSVVVPAPIGHCLTTVGAVNDRYCLAGVSEHAAEICTDKYRFHTVLSEEGLRDAAVRLIRKGEVVSEETAMQMYDSVPCGVILKPRDGSGSRGIVTCRTAEEFLKAVESLNRGDFSLYRKDLTLYGRDFPLCIHVVNPDDSSSDLLHVHEISNNEDLPGFPEDYLAETFVPGEEYGIDGGYVGGEFHMTLLRHKKNTPFPYRQCIGYSSVLAEEAPAFYRNCEKLMQKAGETIGLMNCVVHADIIRCAKAAHDTEQDPIQDPVHHDAVPVAGTISTNADGTESEERSDEPFLIEMSARPSGHNLSNLFTPMATGVTIVDDFLKLALREEEKTGDDARESYRAFCRQLFRPKNTRKLLIRYFDLKPGTVKKLPSQEFLRRQMEEKTLISWHCTIEVGDILEPVTNGASVMGRGYFILQGSDDAAMEQKAQEFLHGFVIM